MSEELRFDDLYWQFLQEVYPLQEPSSSQVLVVGAGVIGLTTALALRASFGPSLRISIVASEWNHPTSATACAFWFPFLSQDVRSNSWAQRTYEALGRFVAQEEKATGKPQMLSGNGEGYDARAPVLRVRVKSVGRAADGGKKVQEEIPGFVLGRRGMREEELPAGYKSGLMWESYIMQSHVMLPLLRRLCARQGIGMKKEKKERGKTTEGGVVVCCAGQGAGELRGDGAVEGVRGTVVRVAPAPALAATAGAVYDAVDDEEEEEEEKEGKKQKETKELLAYVLPRGECVVLGGTARALPLSAALPSDAAEAAGILARCNALCPGVGDAPVLRILSDVRPTRKGGAANRQADDGWIDSYGYGGAGWTVHLGAAADTVALVRAALKPRAKL